MIDLWRRMARGYGWTCVGLLVLSLAIRVAYYVIHTLPAGPASILGKAMRLQLVSFPFVMSTIPVQALAVVLLGAALLFSRKVLWRREGRVRHLRSWAWVAGGTFCVVNNYLFDADPYLAALCWSTTGLLLLRTVDWRSPEGRRWTRTATGALGGLFVALALVFSPTPVVTVSALVWGGWWVLVFFRFGERIPRIEVPLYALVLVPLCGFMLPSMAALVVPALKALPGDVLEDQGYAYGYCENPSRNQLFMTVPVGETGDLERLREGYVAEYDTSDFSRRKEHRLFDDTFYGGLRMMVCLGDAVQISMNGAHISGDLSTSNVLEFSALDPTELKPSIFGDSLRRAQGWDLLGHALAYDPDADAVFYASEWTNTVYRLDRQSGEFDLRVGEVFPGKALKIGTNNGLQTGPGAIHRGRRTLYLSEWGDGATIYELDLDTRQVRRRFDTGDTGSFGLGIDESRDRLFASGLWGINVIDLVSGETIQRLRTGPGARGAIVDERNDLVYVPSTFGGHVWVLDRESLRWVGRLTTGIGGRPGYLTVDGRHFFASDQNRVYRWDVADLGARFRER